MASRLFHLPHGAPVEPSEAPLIEQYARDLTSRDNYIDDLEKQLRELRAEPPLRQVVTFTSEATTLGEILHVVAALRAANHEVRISGLSGDFADFPVIGVSISVVMDMMECVS